MGPRQEKPEEHLMDGQPHPHPKTPDLQKDLVYGFGHLVSSYITDDAHSGDSGDLAQEVFESLGLSDYTIKILELVAEHVWGNYEYTGKEVQATREMFGDAEVQTVKVEVNIDTTKLDKILRPVPVDVTFVDAAGKEIPPDKLEFFVGLKDRVEVDLTEQMRLYASNLAESQVPHMGFLQPYPPTENPGKLTVTRSDKNWGGPDNQPSVAAPEEES